MHGSFPKSAKQELAGVATTGVTVVEAGALLCTGVVPVEFVAAGVTTLAAGALLCDGAAGDPTEAEETKLAIVGPETGVTVFTPNAPGLFAS